MKEHLFLTPYIFMEGGNFHCSVQEGNACEEDMFSSTHRLLTPGQEERLLFTAELCREKWLCLCQPFGSSLWHRHAPLPRAFSPGSPLREWLAISSITGNCAVQGHWAVLVEVTSGTSKSHSLITFINNKAGFLIFFLVYLSASSKLGT